MRRLAKRLGLIEALNCRNFREYGNERAADPSIALRPGVDESQAAGLLPSSMEGRRRIGDTQRRPTGWVTPLPQPTPMQLRIGPAFSPTVSPPLPQNRTGSSASTETKTAPGATEAPSRAEECMGRHMSQASTQQPQAPGDIKK